MAATGVTRLGCRGKQKMEAAKYHEIPRNTTKRALGRGTATATIPAELSAPCTGAPPWRRFAAFGTQGETISWRYAWCRNMRQTTILRY